ncbi:hypothetical protein NPIL_68591, partial [Nephila pilipes]
KRQVEILTFLEDYIPFHVRLDSEKSRDFNFERFVGVVREELGDLSLSTTGLVRLPVAFHLARKEKEVY